MSDTVMTTEPPVAAAPAAPVVTLVQAPRRKLHASRFALAAHVFAEYAITLEHGTPLEAVLEPEFWAHVAQRLRPGDFVHVCDDSQSFYARLYVKAVDRFSARVVIFEQHDLGASQGDVGDPEYTVMWAGRYAKFRVMRIKDNAPIKDGFANREDAELYLRSHAKAMAG